MKAKVFKPAKVKFSPMPIKEEETISRYLRDDYYIGAWKDWFDKKFSEFRVIQRNYDAMTANIRYEPSYRTYKEYEKIEAECIEAVSLAYPYLHREVMQ